MKKNQKAKNQHQLNWKFVWLMDICYLKSNLAFILYDCSNRK